MISRNLPVCVGYNDLANTTFNHHNQSCDIGVNDIKKNRSRSDEYFHHKDIDEQLKQYDIGPLAPYLTLACRGQHCRLKDRFQTNPSFISPTLNKTSDIDSHRSLRPNHKKKITQVKNCPVYNCPIRALCNTAAKPNPGRVSVRVKWRVIISAPLAF